MHAPKSEKVYQKRYLSEAFDNLCIKYFAYIQQFSKGGLKRRKFFASPRL